MEISALICANQSQFTGYLFLAYMILEFWLGKTPKTESGSSLELIINIAKMLFKRKE